MVPPEVVDLRAVAQRNEQAASQVRGKMIPKGSGSLEGIQTFSLEDEVEQDRDDLVEVHEPSKVLHLALGYEHEAVPQEFRRGKALGGVGELGEPFVQALEEPDSRLVHFIVVVLVLGQEGEVLDQQLRELGLEEVPGETAAMRGRPRSMPARSGNSHLRSPG